VDILLDLSWCTLIPMLGFCAGHLSARSIPGGMPAVVKIVLFRAHLEPAKLWIEGPRCGSGRGKRSFGRYAFGWRCCDVANPRSAMCASKLLERRAGLWI
jgi:hypothetical protein